LASASELFIFCDGASPSATEAEIEEIARVREIVKRKNWCGKTHVIEQKNNMGLSKSIMTAIESILNQYGKVIAVEDDILTSPGFLQYMNKALDLYEHDERVMHVNAFNFPITPKNPNSTLFVKSITCPWGWATWKRAWDKMVYDVDYLISEIGRVEAQRFRFNFDDQVSHYGIISGSWDIQWYASVFLHNGLVLWPSRTLVKNIGHDGSGTNCSPTMFYDSDSWASSIPVTQIPVEADATFYKQIVDFYKKNNRVPIRSRLLNFARKVYGRL
jgi:hypothetical protein